MSKNTPLFLNKSHLKDGEVFNPESIEKGLTEDAFNQLLTARIAYFEGRLIKNRAGASVPSRMTPDAKSIDDIPALSIEFSTNQVSEELEAIQEYLYELPLSNLPETVQNRLYRLLQGEELKRHISIESYPQSPLKVVIRLSVLDEVKRITAPFAGGMEG